MRARQDYYNLSRTQTRAMTGVMARLEGYSHRELAELAVQLAGGTINMSKIPAAVNGSKTESAANTYTPDYVEVPKSTGAKAVFLTHVELDPSLPDNTAVSTGCIKSSVAVGKQTSHTSCSLANAGTVTTRKAIREIINAADPDAQIAPVYDGPSEKRGMFEVPEDGDGKFYVTVGVQGAASVGAGNVGYRLDFIIVR